MRNETGGLLVLWVALLLCAAVLATPGAAAASGGEFIVASQIEIPARSSQQFSGLFAVHVGDTASMRDFRFAAPTVVVKWYERRYLSVPGTVAVEERVEFDTWLLHNATFSRVAAGNTAGFLGVYPGAGGSATVRCLDSCPVTLSQPADVPAEHGVLGQRAVAPHYAVSVPVTHVHFRDPGELVYDGGGRIHFSGPDVSVQSDGGALTLRTGAGYRSPLDYRYSWAELEFEEGWLAFDGGDAPVEIAAQQALLEWDGWVVFNAVRGALWTDGGVYHADREEVSLDGAFTAVMRPDVSVDGRSSLSILSGNLRSTSLVVVPLEGAPDTTSSWPLLGVGLLVAGGGSGVFLLARRLRRPKVPATRRLVRHLEVAAEAVKAQDWPGALAALRQARRCEQRAEFAAAEAGYLRRLGRVDEALAVYEEAALLGDFKAFISAAALAMEVGDTGLALAYVTRGVGADPSNLDEVEAEPALDPIRGTPEYERLFQAAADRYLVIRR